MLANLYVYGSEVWGVSLKEDFGYWDKHTIEKTHLHFCKTFLGVNKKACNIGCRAEMGRFLIKIDIDTRILKYWIHLDSLGDNNVVKQAFIMSKTLNDTGQKSFHLIFEDYWTKWEDQNLIYCTHPNLILGLVLFFILYFYFCYFTIIYIHL